MKKAGVILSGCGYLDGAEVQEAVLTLLYLDEAGVEVVCMAPDIDQRDVINHITGKPMTETRNVLVESARIARGKIQDVKDVDPNSLDVLFLPGGYGAAKNLCDFGVVGPDMSVDPGVARMVQAVHDAGKPLGVMCIAPAIIAKLLPGVNLTIGHDKDTAAALEKMGCRHTDCGVSGIVVDGQLKVVTTPAYMLGPWIKDVAEGIRACVQETLKMLD